MSGGRVPQNRVTILNCETDDSIAIAGAFTEIIYIQIMRQRSGVCEGESVLKIEVVV